ncbi:zinc finger MYM-type protein 1-like [Aphis craccivora]|uniref:Zinc finger MYM-type protein 1-like n=1 Tax=Aphis craccivora TaxID=307492 RepID=A0A6G0ZCR0_APHCR|nr:zinc finger MYM-type protein 1-like [Aphis craccivora]
MMNTICLNRLNEFINLLGSKVRNEIIHRIKNSKYFSIIFDSTPDVSRKEQLCQIIRYIREVNNEFIIEESFVDFINTNEKTGRGIATDVLQKLEKDGLDFKNCRGQGYDNGANMAGKYQEWPPKNYQVHNIEKKKDNELENKLLATQWDKWLKKSIQENSSSNSNINCNETIETNSNDVIEQIVLENSNESISEDKILKKNEKLILMDPSSWPPITDKIRTLLINHGPQQGKSSDFYFSENITDKRRFTINWFTKILPNGEKVERSWLLYSDKTKSLYCFPCMLFGNKTMTSPSITDPQKGFNNWKKLNPKIPDHRTNMFKWTDYKTNLNKNNTIDCELQLEINNEKEKWKHILKVVIDCVRFCCVNNLGLRGSNCDIEKPGCGIFLNLISLISNYDSVLSIRNEIIHRIKNSKYFSIIFDFTPDVSRKEQLCQIIRYIREVNNEFIIEETFVDFINTNEKTGREIATNVVQKLEKDGLDFKNCRGQGYDNGANMAGKYQGVQARLKEINKHAEFVPCAAHSLNLIGVHAASVSVKMISFFGIVQNIFNYFSGSTIRWEILMSFMWDKILNQIYRVNKVLQSSNISIDQASKMINSLNVFLQEMRDSGSEPIKTEAISICDKVGIKSELKIKRKKKRKVMSGEKPSDEDISADQFLTLEYYKVLDNMMAQMKWRFEKLSNIANDFQFLSGHSLSVTPVETLKKYAADLVIKYNEDIDPEIINEIEFFKYQAKAILPELQNATALNILNAIKKYELDSTCPNLMIVYRLFLTMPVTVASGERSFSKLKLTKTYLRSTMLQKRLTNSAILSIENEITKNIDFEDVIEDFASKKSRKIQF